MSLGRFGSVTLAAVTACGASAPSADAHNPQKYTNVPFVVPATCPTFDSGVSSSWVNTHTGTQLRVVADAGGQSGFDVFTSTPASVNGTITSANGGYGPYTAGNVTFSVSGLPAGGGIIWQAVYSGPTITNRSPYPIVFPVNGVVTIPTGANNGQAPGSSLLMVKVYVQTIAGSSKDTTGTYATVNLSNFRLNNSVLLGDTTVTDSTVTAMIPPEINILFYYCS